MSATAQLPPYGAQAPQSQIPSFNDWTARNPLTSIYGSATRDSILWKVASEGLYISLQGLFYGGCSHIFSTLSFATAGVYGLAYGVSASLTSRVKEYFIDMNSANTVKKVISYIIEIGVNLMSATYLVNSLGYSITFLEGFKIYALSAVVAMSALGVVTLLFGPLYTISFKAELFKILLHRLWTMKLIH